MLIEYVPKRFHGATVKLIETSNQIITSYVKQGYRLTLRQLYYRLVSQNTIANTIQEYKRLGDVISEARLAGLVDWDAIEDRTRNLKAIQSWSGVKEAVKWLGNVYHLDMWQNQQHRPEVWIEKEALAGVFEKPCSEFDVPFFCCRGYNSQSEMWAASMRLQEYANQGQTPIIFHFGDHDPSGIDMTRDIQDRMATFQCDLKIDRRALNIGQVKRYKLPPNPARQTDTRFKVYMKQFGKESWELDALEPQVLHSLVTQAIDKIRDQTAWDEMIAKEKTHRAKLQRTAKRMRN